MTIDNNINTLCSLQGTGCDLPDSVHQIAAQYQATPAPVVESNVIPTQTPTAGLT